MRYIPVLSLVNITILTIFMFHCANSAVRPLFCYLRKWWNVLNNTYKFDSKCYHRQKTLEIFKSVVQLCGSYRFHYFLQILNVSILRNTSMAKLYSFNRMNTIQLFCLKRSLYRSRFQYTAKCKKNIRWCCIAKDMKNSRIVSNGMDKRWQII